MCFLHAFLIALIKKICASHIFKGHVSFLYVGCKKNFTNQFVGNFCPTLPETGLSKAAHLRDPSMD
jgi:hypothetical protein